MLRLYIVFRRCLFDTFKKDLQAYLKKCSSGKELIAKGFESDVELAAAFNVSDSVPLFTENAYINSKKERSLFPIPPNTVRLRVIGEDFRRVETRNFASLQELSVCRLSYPNRIAIPPKQLM